MPDRILYLHGLLSSPASNKALFFNQRLSKRGIGVRVPDLNEGDFSRLTTTRAVRLACAETASLEPPVWIFGSSFGGRVAVHAAAGLGDAVAGLVLMAPAVDLVDVWARTQPPEAMEAWRRDGQVLLDHPAYGRPVPLGYGFYEDALRTNALPTLRPALPVLLLHGAEDQVVAPAHSKRFVQTHPATRLVTLPGVNHSMEGAEETLWQEVVSFLREHDPDLASLL